MELDDFQKELIEVQAQRPTTFRSSNADGKRAGTFSSSKNFKLMENNKKGDDFGAPGLKYIKQVGFEIKLGREINCERESRPTTWGTAIERQVFNILPLSYVYMSGSRFFHPTLKRWSGSPDLLQGTTVGDVKCPYSLEMFCDKLEVLNKGLEAYRDKFPEDYWQHISNAILLEENGYPCDSIEAIIYCPYKSELEEIREMVLLFEDNSPYKWIYYASDSELPWIPDGGHYQNINKFKFSIPPEDKEALTQRIKMAHERITEPKLMIA